MTKLAIQTGRVETKEIVCMFLGTIEKTDESMDFVLCGCGNKIHFIGKKRPFGIFSFLQQENKEIILKVCNDCMKEQGLVK